jgi:hypothetical protein
MYKKELRKLAKGLIERGYNFTFNSICCGWQIRCEDWDAICHEYSYGSERGLLEIMGSIVQVDNDNVEGWLTAKEVLKRIDEKRQKEVDKK